ncbi:MAG: hypothetical protein F4X56_00770 [Gammaproteobacteria bacterium]|nr:hypothetical protein [Candidatus Poribacteria bacterium]MYC24432.1 hypothetical protein [Gammaproteobacteria bacterium]
MPKYEVGITEINTLVRRLGYVSAILRLLEHKTLSESVLYSQLEKWSLNHEKDLMGYANQQGFIKTTRGQVAPKRYANLAVSLGLVGRIAGACRVTRFGKTLLPFLHQVSNQNPFELTDAERCTYLYWLLVKDSDRLLTIIRMLVEGTAQSLSDLQDAFPMFYLQQLQARLLTAEESVARDILAARNRVAHWKKETKRSVENIVPPRIHWLADLGLVSVENDGKRYSRLTETGIRFSQYLPKIQETQVFHTSPVWLRKQFFGITGQIFMGTIDRHWTEIHDSERKDLLYELTFQAFETLRSTPTPRISLYPALIYMALLLNTDNGIAANLEELQADLDTFSKEPDTRYAVRFSHRENESYLIFFPT